MTHNVTADSRAEVSALRSFGHTYEEIASHLGCHKNTLTKCYKDELDNAVLRANSKVANKLYQKAVDSDDLQAQIFWLKTRAKWRNADAEAITQQTDEVKAEIESLRADLSLKSKKDY